MVLATGSVRIHALLKQAIIALRVLAAWFLAVAALGYPWFIDDQGILATAHFAVGSLALAAFAFMPRRLMPRPPWRQVLPILPVAALLSTAILIHGDLALINGADHAAAGMRLLQGGVFIVLFVEAGYRARYARRA